MPQALPLIAAYAVDALLVEAGISGVVSAAAAAAAGAAVAAAQSSQAQRKARNAASANRRDLTVVLQTGSAPRRTIYGRAKVSGVLVYAYSSGEDHKFMHRVIVLTGHEVDGYDRAWLNDDEITADLVGALPSNGGFSSSTLTGRYTENGGPVAHIEAMAGATTQAAMGSLVIFTAGQWSSNHRLRGCAYVRVQNNYTPTVYVDGLPNFACVVRGKKIYDPRTATTVFSDNAALVIRDYLTSALRVPTARIDDASFIAAANVCDEYLTCDISAGGGAQGDWVNYMARAIAAGTWEFVSGTTYRQRRYRINGVVEADASPGEVLDQMVNACAGWISYTGGQWRLVAGGYTAPTLTLTANDLRAGPSFQPRPGRRDLFNVARGTYTGPTSNYVATDFPAPESSSLVSEDGGTQMPLDVDLPFTNEALASQRIASIFLQKSRQGVLTFPATLTGLALRPGDVVAVTLPHFGFSAKTFRVEGWALSADAGIDLVLREDSAAGYTWTLAGRLVDPNPDLNLPNPWSVPAPSGLAATSGISTTLVQNDGTLIQRTKLSWTIPNYAFARHLEIETREVGGTVWTPHPAADDLAGEAYLLNLRTGVQHEIRARRLNTVGARSAWASITYTPLAMNAIDNLLVNSDFTEDLGYGSALFNDARALRGWAVNYINATTPNIGRNYSSGTAWNVGPGGAWMWNGVQTAGSYYGITQRVRVTAGVAYEASVYCSAHRCPAYLYLRFLDVNGVNVGDAQGAPDTIDAGTGVIGQPFDPMVTHARLWRSGIAPAGAVYAELILLKSATTSGQSDSYAFWSKALVCVAPAGVTRETATPWVPSSMTTLDGGVLGYGSVTDVLENLPADGGRQHINNNPSFTPDSSGTFASVTYTNNTAASVNVVATYSGRWGYFVSNGVLQVLYVGVSVNNAGAISSIQNVDGSFGQVQPTAGAANNLAGVSNVISVAPGATCTVSMGYRGGRLAPGVLDFTLYWGGVTLNLQGIRK